MCSNVQSQSLVSDWKLWVLAGQTPPQPWPQSCPEPLHVMLLGDVGVRVWPSMALEHVEVALVA